MTGWQPINGWPNYEIHTRTGDVRSLPHTDSRGHRWPGRLLRITTPAPTVPATKAGGGGPRCSLNDNGRRQTFYPARYLKQHPPKEGNTP